MLKKFIINKTVNKISGNKRCFADLWEKSKNLCDTRISIWQETRFYFSISDFRIAGNSFFINNKTLYSSITDRFLSTRPSGILLLVTNGIAVVLNLDGMTC